MACYRKRRGIATELIRGSVSCYQTKRENTYHTDCVSKQSNVTKELVRGRELVRCVIGLASCQC